MGIPKELKQFENLKLEVDNEITTKLEGKKQEFLCNHLNKRLYLEMRGGQPVLVRKRRLRGRHYPPYLNFAMLGLTKEEKTISGALKFGGLNIARRVEQALLFQNRKEDGLLISVIDIEPFEIPKVYTSNYNIGNIHYSKMPPYCQVDLPIILNKLSDKQKKLLKISIFGREITRNKYIKNV